MGQGAHSKPDSRIDLRKYKQRNTQLSDQEILDIKHIFDSLEPVDDYVDLNDVHKLYSQSLDKETIERNFGNKSRVNFDEFFDVMSAMMVETKHKFKNIEFDSNVKSVSCFYCPYPSDSKRNDNHNNSQSAVNS